MKVTVYSTTSCPWCHKAKEFLKANKVDFEDINITEQPEKAEEVMKKSGQTGVPVIIVDEEVIVGFDEDKLKEVLKL